jgi:hypothetical protein
MKNQDHRPRQIVDRFLDELGNPLPDFQVEAARHRVLRRLQQPPALELQQHSAQAHPMRWAAALAAVVVLSLGGSAPLLFPWISPPVATAAGGELFLPGIAEPLPLTAAI